MEENLFYENVSMLPSGGYSVEMKLNEIKLNENKISLVQSSLHGKY